MVGGNPRLPAVYFLKCQNLITFHPLFLIASCYEIEAYEQDALCWGDMPCIDKLQFTLLQDKLVEYASQRKKER